MKFLNALLVTASLVQAHPKPYKSHRALYFLDSDPQGASVVSFNIGKDGSLGQPQRTSTGGKGLISNNVNGSVTMDPLFSQGSIIVSGNKLFTVNAGSNTLAAFYIPKENPTHPILLGEPVDTVGTVPNTVAYSPKNKLACVANTGPKPGVQCFTVSSCDGLKPQGNLKPLPVIDQTSPPTGPPNTVSNILFNPSESALFVTIKGNGMENGFVYAYKVENGHVSEEAVKSQPENLPVAFGMSFISDDSAVISTPAYGAAFVSIAQDLTVSTKTNIAVPKQMATCWTAYSADTGSVYLLDGGVPDITALNTETMAIGRTLQGYAAGKGNFDAIIGGDKLYVLQAAPAIAVFDLKRASYGPKVTDLSWLGNRAPWTGMALY
ncbi:3-carboxymuconate cyclase [Fusarium beomiforme]|uniref:3-carboxymuconate cyclase n=1 Tax=Fusarium beomiforme TaxID=44412 RepID=A0A9P5AKS3_9HYPO|nr:3-carboxymuconate cyclase [Fusarium beomiforme]